MILLLFKERNTFSRVQDSMRGDLCRIHWEQIYSTSEGGWLSWVKYYFYIQLAKLKALLERRGVLIDRDIPVPDTQRRIGWKSWFDAFSKYSDKTHNPEPANRSGSQSRRRSTVIFRQGGRSPTNVPSELPFGNDVRKLAEFRKRLGNFNSRIVTFSGSEFWGSHVLHLQYSPNGRWLVVCHKYECVIYNVEVRTLFLMDL